VTASASDVGDPPEAREIVRSDHRADVNARLRRHCPPEDRSFVRPILQVSEDPLGLHDFNRGFASADRVLQFGQAAPDERQAHHLSEGAHRHGMIAAQQV